MSKFSMKIQDDLKKSKELEKVQMNKDNLKGIFKKSEELIKILEKNGEEYYNELCNLKETYTDENIKKLLDYTHYMCYMGSHLHGLIYLVGDLVEKPLDGVYGTKSSVSEELGIKILEKFIEYDVDFYSENYYNETPLQNLNSNGYTKRKNNNRFKKNLQDYYITRLNKTLGKINKNIR